MPRLRRWWRDGKRVAKQDAKELAKLGASPQARRSLLKALRRPEALSRPRRHVLLLLVLLMALAVWGLGSLALRALGHPWVGPWDLAWWLALVGFATTVALPVPFEPALLAVSRASGWGVAVLATSLSKTAGAAVVYLLGGALRQKLEALKGKHPWVAAFVRWTEKLAMRGSYVALGAMMAVPLFPDTLPVYVFSVLGLRLPPFLLACLAGTAVRTVLVLALGAAAGI